MTLPTPLQEAQVTTTSPERLLILATGLDPAVRQAARHNPRFPRARRGLLERAEQQPQRLDGPQLSVLARLGPFGQELACAHPRTMDDTLTWLVQQGQVVRVLEGQPERKEEWLWMQARRDPTLRDYLCLDASVPIPLQERARSLRASLQSGDVHPPPPPGVAGLAARLKSSRWTRRKQEAPATMVDSPRSEQTALLRAKLQNRREVPELNLEEAKLLEEDVRLQRLAARHPLLAVPLLEWLDHLHPHGQARETLLYRLEHHDLEGTTFQAAVQTGDWELRAALARNPALPAALQAQLVQDPDWWVRASVAENPNATPEQLATLALEDDHAVIRENAARHPHTPPGTLLSLAGDGEAAVRLQVARNPSTPPEAMAWLARDEKYATREAVAAHPLTPPDVLQALAGEENERVSLVARLRLSPLTEEGAQEALATRRRNVKLAVASRPQVPLPVLAQLAGDRNPLIRAQVGLSPQLPELVRDALQEDPDPAVQRVALAADPSAPPEALGSLPRHDVRVRQGLSRNGATPAAVLDVLSDDALEDVRLAVVLNPASPEGALQRRLPEQPLRPGIRQHPLYDRVKPKLHHLELQEARDPATPVEALQALIESDAPGVRRQVAFHPHASTDILLRLAQDDQDEVRLGLTQRTTLPEEVQQALVQDKALAVRDRLLRRTDLLPQVMLVLAQKPLEDQQLLLLLAEHPGVTGEVLTALASSPRAEVRARVAGHARTPAEVQRRLASDPEDTVTAEVLHNPTCPPEALAVLARRARYRVRVAEHERTSPQTLEFLAFDTGYARLLRLQKLLKRAPPSVQDHPQVQRWLRGLKRRASERAFKELSVLAAVIKHPAATASAVRFASRLNHPAIFEAREQRHARFASSPAPLPEAPHD